MKIIFLIPPSEGKNPDGKPICEKTFYNFAKPLEIAKNATEKDLKCSWDRYNEAIFLNSHTEKSVILSAIERYNGVMFSAIDYGSMNENAKIFFDENFLIISGFYGIVKPKDWIVNYKLPASTKWLYNFWGDRIFAKILEEKPDYIVNLLSGDYEKFFKFAKNIEKFGNTKVININFLKENGQKISHGVKSIKWRFIKEICENPEKFLEKISNIEKENPEKNILEIDIKK